MFKKTIFVPERGQCKEMRCVDCDLDLIDNCKEFAKVLIIDHETCTEGAPYIVPDFTIITLDDVIRDLLEAKKKIEKLEKEVFKEASLKSQKDPETKITYSYRGGRVLYRPPFIKGVEYVGMA